MSHFSLQKKNSTSFDITGYRPSNLLRKFYKTSTEHKLVLDKVEYSREKTRDNNRK